MANEKGLELAQGLEVLKSITTIDELSRQRAIGFLDDEAYVKAVLDATLEAQHATNLIEQQRIKMIGLENGFESLTTDTSGHRSIEWMRITGLAFATGIATNCVAVGIVNDRTGMAAAHRNMIDPEVLRRSIVDFMLKGRPLDESQSRKAEQMLTDDDIRRIISSTVNEAFHQFDQLRPEQNLSSLSLVMIGMDFASGRVVKIAESAAVDSVQAVGKGRTYLNGAQANIEMHFGELGGYLYGGPQHPLYPTPTHYVFT